MNLTVSPFLERNPVLVTKQYTCRGHIILILKVVNKQLTFVVDLFFSLEETDQLLKLWLKLKIIYLRTTGRWLVEQGLTIDISRLIN